MRDLFLGQSLCRKNQNVSENIKLQLSVISPTYTVNSHRKFYNSIHVVLNWASSLFPFLLHFLFSLYALYHSYFLISSPSLTLLCLSSSFPCYLLLFQYLMLSLYLFIYMDWFHSLPFSFLFSFNSLFSSCRSPFCFLS